MNIFIAATAFDPIGCMMIDALPTSEIDEISRRVNRVRTLDGGAVANDTGQWSADRTFVISWRIKDEEQITRARRLVSVYPLLTVSVKNGCYSAIPEKITNSGGAAEMTLLVMEKLS